MIKWLLAKSFYCTTSYFFRFYHQSHPVGWLCECYQPTHKSRANTRCKRPQQFKVLIFGSIENPGGLVNDGKCTSLKPPLWLKIVVVQTCSSKSHLNILWTYWTQNTNPTQFTCYSGDELCCGQALRHPSLATTIPHQLYNYCIHLVRYTYNIR